ncbi:DUF4097 family beta strand repeat-containing protein [Enterococcus devriesei]|uniref:DUF4097 family beta strand repeat-containing protein n=1 Tax=Enterococcus devriesei TaxID=319970 RepID=UPI0028AA98AA|nr:DUF4097 family beta strand repeat-containing protein [Enterococcus devriesei]
MKKIVVGLLLVGAALVSMSSLIFHNRTSNETFTSQKTVKKLIIEDRNMPIEIVGASGNQTKISYQKSRDIKYKIKQKGDTLNVERQGKRWFNFSIFNFGASNAKVTVEVPRTRLKDLDVETSNGKLTVENLMLDNLDLESSNSKMQLKDLDVKTIDAETSNGNIQLDRLTFDEGSFDTSNGKFDLNNLEFKEGEFETSNGAIRLNHLQGTKSIYYLKTSNAKVNGTIVGGRADFATVSKTSNASNNLTNQSDGSKELEVKTSNGDIAIDFIR